MPAHQQAQQGKQRRGSPPCASQGQRSAPAPRPPGSPAAAYPAAPLHASPPASHRRLARQVLVHNELDLVLKHVVVGLCSVKSGFGNRWGTDWRFERKRAGAIWSSGAEPQQTRSSGGSRPCPLPAPAPTPTGARRQPAGGGAPALLLRSFAPKRDAAFFICSASNASCCAHGVSSFSSASTSLQGHGTGAGQARG